MPHGQNSGRTCLLYLVFLRCNSGSGITHSCARKKIETRAGVIFFKITKTKDSSKEKRIGFSSVPQKEVWRYLLDTHTTAPTYSPHYRFT